MNPSLVSGYQVQNAGEKYVVLIVNVSPRGEFYVVANRARLEQIIKAFAL
jgi:hypothetical protein